MAFLNFKPFYNRDEGFLLRDLQVGGSLDAGIENNPLTPAVLTTSAFNQPSLVTPMITASKVDTAPNRSRRE